MIGCYDFEKEKLYYEKNRTGDDEKWFRDIFGTEILAKTNRIIKKSQ